jgi:hypothetical protein
MPTHVITRTFTAAGIVERPSRATPLTDHYGVTLNAGDGTPTNVRTSTKRRWRFTWKSADPTVVERWRQRYEAGATFTMVDPHGATYTAMLPLEGGWSVGGYEYETSDPTSVSLTLYPDLTIETREA